MKTGRILLSVLGTCFGALSTLLFQPTVFCDITLPVVAKMAGWKARAVSARLSATGILEIRGLEAVDPKKSRLAMDSARVEFDPLRLLAGKVEIHRAKLEFSMVDLEWRSSGASGSRSLFPPVSVREASVDLVEGRLRTETGAWILKSGHASAEGWDGRTPQEIRVQLGELDWNGPGQQELATTTQAIARKSKDPQGGDLWTVHLTADVSTVVDLPPWNHVAPCHLKLDGTASQSPRGDWKAEDLQAVWEGVGGFRLESKLGGTYTSAGTWTAKLDLAPADLRLAGLFLQARGVQAVSGTLGGVVNLYGGPRQPLGFGLEGSGQAVQLVAAGATWPAQPSALAISARGEWQEVDHLLKVEKLALNLGREGQPSDFQLALDHPAKLQVKGLLRPTSTEPALLQWAARGLELAAVAPIFLDPQRLKLQGGKLSASGQAKILGDTVEMGGRVESRSMTATGDWVRGQLVIQSGAVDFQGSWAGGTKIRMDQVALRAAWEGGAAEDLAATAKAEWDLVAQEGFLAGDLRAGMTGLGQAWAGAKFWPETGTAQAHWEFSGNPARKGAGLLSLSLDGMRWPGEKAAAWGAKLSSEVVAEQGTWGLPELILQAGRAGETLVDGKVSALWNPVQNVGRIKITLARAESSFLVPLLKNVTPDWQWSEASGRGSFEFTRQDQHDRVKAELQAAITVDTGTARRPCPVDFSSVSGNLQAVWPSGTSGIFSVESLALIALHRDGSEAVRASLDAPLALEKKGPGQWQPSGRQSCSGRIQFSGWPVGILAPLALPNARENSITGTLSGFLLVRNDPGQGILSAEVDLACPDLSIHLPHLQFTDNKANLKADLDLGSDRNLALRRMSFVCQQAGVNWIESAAERSAQPGLAVKGKADLAVVARNVPDAAPYVSAGTLVWKATFGEAQGTRRKVGFSVEGTGLAMTLPEIGPASELQAKVLGELDWDQGRVTALDDCQINVTGLGGELQIGNLDWKAGEALAWQSARASAGWVAYLAGPWMQPNRWRGGDLTLGSGFWEPGEHGSSGELDARIIEGRISDQPGPFPLSARLRGDWEYDRRTRFFILKDATLLFSDFPEEPVQIPLFRAGPGLFQANIAGGVADLRGLLPQIDAWQSVPHPGEEKRDSVRIDIVAALDQVVLPDFRVGLPDSRVGPVNIVHFRYGPEGIFLEPSSVEAQGGLIRGSAMQTGGKESPLQISLFIEKFPLGAVLGPMIQDARGPLGGWGDLQFTGQAAGAKLEDLQRTLTGAGTFRLYQAHLENLPAVAKSLQGAGQFLGSAFIAGSQINDLGGSFQAVGSRISTQDLRVSGSALEANLRGSLDWMSREIDFQVALALTREAIQSSGQLQGAMTQLVGSSNQYYTRIPGSARITGTLSDPKVQMDVGAMLAEGGINLLLNAPSGVLQGADGATGGLTAPVTAPLQGFFNLLRGN